MFALIAVESRFDTRALSTAGAVGLMQVLPSTAGVLRARLYDPAANLKAGTAYLRKLLDSHDGNVRLSLLAYNRGPTRVARLLRSRQNPANGYARRVLSQQLNGGLQ